MGQIIKNKTYYTYDDLTIMPSFISDVGHRSECLPWDEYGMLPLFTAPMDTVVGEDNFKEFEEKHIHAILPRTAPLDTRKFYSTKGRWAAYSLKEFSDVFCNEDDKLPTTHKLKALIDVANGHMKCIFDVAKKAKKIYGDNLILMGGNIANPHTYEQYARAGFSYVRCSIGTGCGCLSSSNTGIHVPIASLINEIAEIKKQLKDDYRTLPYIIADGGIRGYRDIIKALALGADYVMCGSIFAKMLESSAQKASNSEEWYNLGVDISKMSNVHMDKNAWYGEYDGKEYFLGDIRCKFYGMASRDGQIALNGKKTKTSEGITKTLPVEYTMETWVSNFTDYLRSAMSYVGAETLDAFRYLAVLVVNSQNAINAVNK